MNKSKKVIVISIAIIIITIFIWLMINQMNNINITDMSSKKVARINEDVEIIPMVDINEKDVKIEISGEAMYNMDISNKTTIANDAEFIIIGTVESLDGVVTYNPTQKTYVMPQTVGKIKVNRVIKGNLEYSEIPFMKSGATVSLLEYEKILFPSEITKMEIDKFSEKEKKNTYVTTKMEDDTKIEQGKTYLMYLSYSEDYGAYAIRYFKYGLREIESDRINDIVGENAKKLDIDELKSIRVKDNTNGEYEPLESIIPSNIWNNMK